MRVLPAPLSAAAAEEILIPPPKRGIILYSVRDAVSRDPTTSDQPSGFREILEYLAAIGYKQVEFAGYRQHANAEGGANLGLPDNNYAGARLLRQWLDDNGLVCNGNHGSVPSTINDTTIAQFNQGLDIAEILGMEHVGTGSAPTGSAYAADWDAAADRWNFWGEMAAARHLKLYTHSHHAEYAFLLDSPPLDELGRPTRSSGIRRLPYFMNQTDPKFVHFEIDTRCAFSAQFRYQTYTNPDGEVVTDIFDPAAQIAAQPHRYPLFHLKDGVYDLTNPAGYYMVPFGLGTIDYATFYRSVGPKGFPVSHWEQDNASSWVPGGSLAAAKITIDNMATFRG